MSDNRKYYYLKLKENYFDDDSIVLLESMQDGVLYSNILLKLYLKSLKHGGRLQLDEDIPYTAQMIATITRQQIGTVERALQIFLKLGLVEVLDSGTFYMSNIELLIGQSSTEAERKRAARLQNKALSAPRTNGGRHTHTPMPPTPHTQPAHTHAGPFTPHPHTQSVVLCLAVSLGLCLCRPAPTGAPHTHTPMRPTRALVAPIHNKPTPHTNHPPPTPTHSHGHTHHPRTTT